MWKRFLDELADPMIIILIVAAVISGITAAYEGESFADVIIIMFWAWFRKAKRKPLSPPCRKSPLLPVR